jgi:hypothetical protein
MLTTTDESGRLNNYAIEPQVYAASYPSFEQQRSYWMQGSLAALLVATLLVVSFVVS